MNLKTINPLWRIADTLTVQQAAALIAEVDPSAIRFNLNNSASLANENGQVGSDGVLWVQTAFEALTNAISVGTLPAKVVHESRAVTEEDCQVLIDMHQVNDFDDGIAIPSLEQLACEDERVVRSFFVKNEPSWAKSLVSRTDLLTWLKSNGFCSGFFFPADVGGPDYLDPNNPRYAPKLAAAVRAWQAVTDPGKRSPKQALEKWIREHAADLRLTDEDGNPVTQAVEDCSKVANWQLGGGAPKTPTL